MAVKAKKKESKAQKSKTQKKKVAVVTVRASQPGGMLEVDIDNEAQFARIAHWWGYILRSRSRWAGNQDRRQSLRERAIEDLERAGLTREFIRRLSAVSHIEVELHAWNAEDTAVDRIHEAAAEVPWEYLLSAATRSEGRHKPLLITRLLQNGSVALIPPPPSKILFVESLPGRLEDCYEFATERARIQAAVGADGTSGGDSKSPPPVMGIQETPSVSELRRKVRSEHWEAMHVSGVDTHQVTSLVEDFYDELDEKPDAWGKIAEQDGNILDGMILRETGMPELPVKYDELADVLINPKQAPYVVTLNLYYSGARIARELVRRGAHVAIGFLDEIDDEVAELFFQAFYWEWCHTANADIITSFLMAWQTTTAEGSLHGTSIVIWTGRSVFDKFEKSPRGKHEVVTEDRIARLARHSATPIGELLQVEFDDQPADVNYSLLHNERPLFSKLTLTKLVKEPVEDISVLVEVNLGTQTYPYRYTQLVLDKPQLALAGSVKIPLTADLPRSLRERVRSTVYVKVTCGQRTAFETTKRVTLLPIDEWFDDTENNPWLPSFVVPRDPAILKIINSARRYLIGIRDDPMAGFEGYQAIDKEAFDPSLEVDRQVQAIWTAIVNDYRLQYINPPPAYSEQTQRLRTPSDVLESGTGTCVDLALLLASCLEYIDIYPVVVLLTGHAFVGYWRSEEAYDRFVEMQNVPETVPEVGSVTARKAGVPLVDPYGWRLTSLCYDEIVLCMEAGDLVMLEATYLTAMKSFDEARTEGTADMEPREDFDSLLDIRLARTASPPVTPIPILF